MSKPAQSKAAPIPKKVKVMILKQVGHYSAGQEVEVTEVEAKYLCEPKCRQSGGGQIHRWQNAMLVEEYQKIKEMPVDKGGFSLHELKQMGRKNIVQTPAGPIMPEGKIKAYEAKFEVTKDLAEGASAQVAVELNESNPNNKEQSA